MTSLALVFGLVGCDTYVQVQRFAVAPSYAVVQQQQLCPIIQYQPQAIIQQQVYQPQAVVALQQAYPVVQRIVAPQVIVQRQKVIQREVVKPVKQKIKIKTK